MKNQAPDKKQLMVVGALFAVMVGVGAFQLMGSGAPAPKPAAKKEESKDAKRADRQVNPDDPTQIDQVRDPALKDLALRDPFLPRDGYTNPDGSKSTAPNTAPGANPTPTQTVKEGANTPEKMGGSVSGLRPLPNVDPDPSGGNGPAKPGDIAAEPAYYCLGIVTGNVPVAILVDDEGNQSVVKVGGTFKNARLISIDSRHVVVEYARKRHQLDVAPPPEKPSVGSNQAPQPSGQPDSGLSR